MNIAKAAPPQMLPISASINLAQLPDDAAALQDVCETLQKYELFDHPIGLSSQHLYLTGHLGTGDARDALTKLGFQIGKQFIYVYNLTRHHDTTPLSSTSLCADILHMKQHAANAILNYETQTDMGGIEGVLGRGAMAENLMRLLVPAHSRSLNLVLPPTTSIAKLSFDDIVLGEFATHHKVHQKSIDFYLRQEISLWAAAVQALFPEILPAFTTFSNSYLLYLRDQAAQPDITNAVVDKITAAVVASREVKPPQVDPASTDPTGGQPAVSGPAPTLKDRLRTMKEQAGEAVAEGPLTVKSEEPASRLSHVKDVRLKAHFIYQAWCIPTVSNKDASVNVPAWAMDNEEWGFHSHAGHWLVRQQLGVMLLTHEQFLYLYDVIE
jgi:hypothetical protein